MGGEMKLIEVSVAAQKLAVSEKTIRRMIVDPNCPLEAVRVYRGAIRVSMESLERCLLKISKQTLQ